MVIAILVVLSINNASNKREGCMRTPSVIRVKDLQASLLTRLARIRKQQRQEKEISLESKTMTMTRSIDRSIDRTNNKASSSRALILSLQ